MASPATSIPLYLSTYVLFLTDLCSSGVLNYDKERAKLCSKAGIKDRNCTSSESILINEALRVAELEDDLAEANQELGDVRREKKTLETKLVARETALGFRTSIEDIEKLLYPDWIFDTRLTRKQRLILSLSLGLTKYGRLLMERIKNSPGVSVHDFASAIDEFYDKLSLKLGHFQQIRTPNTTEEWTEVYDLVGARQDFQQKSLKIVLEPFDTTPDDLQSTSSTGNTVQYSVLLTNVDFNAKQSDIEQGVRASISNIPLSTVDIAIVKNYKGKRTDYTAVAFETTTHISTETVFESLKMYKKFPFQRPNFAANVYCEWEKSESFILHQSTSTTQSVPSTTQSVPAG